MSNNISGKQFLLTLANFNLFKNTNDQIEFSLSKDSRVKADYSGYDRAKGFDVRGIKARTEKMVGYIRLSLSVLSEDGTRQYFNGALFTNDKKTTDKQPDFQGSVNLDKTTNGPKLRLSAWKKTGEKAGDYLSISIQEFQSNEGSSNASSNGGGGDFDMNDAPAPTPRGRAASPAAAPKSGAAPANAFNDPEDDDIPFLNCAFSTESKMERKMKRYGW